MDDLISRKALISHIENQSREWGEDYDVQQILGDIEDLPPVNTQPCEDCISRQAVHEAITKWAGSMSVLIALPTREVRPLLDSIHKLQPVKPQERTGHWNLFHTTEHGMREDSYFKCNKCNYESYKEYNFCPDCGAKMVELQESEVQE